MREECSGFGAKLQAHFLTECIYYINYNIIYVVDVWKSFMKNGKIYSSINRNRNQVGVSR